MIGQFSVGAARAAQLPDRFALSVFPKAKRSAQVYPARLAGPTEVAGLVGEIAKDRGFHPRSKARLRYDQGWPGGACDPPC
jgi:hypothetical protein